MRQFANNNMECLVQLLQRVIKLVIHVLKRVGLRAKELGKHRYLGWKHV